MRIARSALVLAVLIFTFSSLSFAGFTSITCTLTVTPTSGSAPLTVTATGACTGGGGTLTTSIDWGDDTSTNGSTGQHTYNFPGFYTVTINAFDQFEDSGSASQSVDVTSFPTVVGATGNGMVGLINADGSIGLELDTGAGGTLAGMLFDFNGRLFTTDFTAGKVTVFDFFIDSKQLSPRKVGRRPPPSASQSVPRPLEGNFPPGNNFGPGFNCQPESFTEDLDGFYYVGTAGCNKTVTKLDSDGNVIATYTVATENQGSDWIEISADECTLYYTSEGKRVLRYNTCGRYQMTDFASGLHKALAVRLVYDGGVLVADNVDIHRTDASGKIIQTYDASGADCWTGIQMDPNQESFWATDACTSRLYHFDLAAGTVLANVKVNVPQNTLYGLALPDFGQVFFGSLETSPSTGTVNAGGSTTFTVTLGNFDGVRTSQAQTGTAEPTLILTCSSLPKGALCSFNPPQIPASGGTSTLTITTNNTQVISGNTGFEFKLRYMAFAVPFAFGATMLWRKRTRTLGIAMTALMLVAVSMLFACGVSKISNTNTGAGATGAPNPGVTPPGTYTIYVNAGQGPSTTYTSVDLTVK